MLLITMYNIDGFMEGQWTINDEKSENALDVKIAGNSRCVIVQWT